MFLIHRLRALLRNWFRQRDFERDLKDELQAYADLVADEHRARGVDDETAARRGRLALGGVEPVAEAVRAARTGIGIERFIQDVRYALRGLRRTPGSAVMAVLTLGLGIGVTTAMFSVVDATVFKPLPYRTPDHLVRIVHVEGRETTSQRRSARMSWEQIDRWRAELALIEGIEIYRTPRLVGEIDGATAPLTFLGQLSPGVFDLLGVMPVLGRPLISADAVSGQSALVLSDNYWRRLFNADRNVLGRTVSIDGQPHVIVGVMPPTFGWGVGRGDMTMGWTLLDERVERTVSPRWGTNIVEIVRLRQGLSLEAAEREIDAAAMRLQAGIPTDERWEADLAPFDSRREYDADTRLVLFVLFGASALLVLVPCANVASLLLARGLDRRGELAIRSALGATRRRLVRQLVTEGFVLASLGGLVALVVTWWSVSVIPNLLPIILPLAVANPLEADARVIVFCISIVMVATLLCSLMPALRHSRHQAADFAVSHHRTAGTRSHRRLSGALQGAQVAFVLVLLCGHTLLASSFLRMVTVDPGYDIDGLIRVVVSVPPDSYPARRAAAFFDEVIERTRRVPGITAATFGNSPVGDVVTGATASGQDGAEWPAHLFFTAPDYHAALGIPIKMGRAFTASDTSTSLPVAIISEGLAETAWPDASPLGRQIRFSGDDSWTTVVGVVRDIKTARFAERVRLHQVYRPLTQDDGMLGASRSLVVRSDGDPRALIAQLSGVVAAMDPLAKLTTDGTFEAAEAYDFVRAAPRIYLVLMTIMAGLALATATVGLYASASYAVNQRKQEIGIRMALGAEPGRIQRSLLRETLRPVLIGTSAGLFAAFWLTEFLEAMLYDVSPRDPIATLAAVTVLVTAALLGALVPARRAARVDPAITLRAE